MSTQVLQRSCYGLTLSEEERDVLLVLLRQALREERLSGEPGRMQGLVRKLEVLCPAPIGEATATVAGIEEEGPLVEELYIDETGRFQMAAADLESFARVLRDHEIRVQIDDADAFRSGGVMYGYGRLLRPYEADSVAILHRMWRTTGGRPAAPAKS